MVPQDIDIEAIAQYCKATVVYEPLKGCEARIVGNQHRAIITVNSADPRPRQRFSAAHELAHWMYDRGKLAFACSQKILAVQWSDEHPESRANHYASDLLLPTEFFVPLAKKKPLTIDTARDLAEEFQTSLTATAIRLVEHGAYPGMVVCNSPKGREWFFRGEDVSEYLWPVKTPGMNTVAYDLLHGSSPENFSLDTDADEWITHRDAAHYTIHEESTLIAEDIVLSLLWWKEEQQLIDLEEQSVRYRD